MGSKKNKVNKSGGAATEKASSEHVDHQVQAANQQQQGGQPILNQLDPSNPVHAKFEEYLNRTFGKTGVNPDELLIAQDMDERALQEAIKSLDAPEGDDKARAELMLRMQQGKGQEKVSRKSSRRMNRDKSLVKLEQSEWRRLLVVLSEIRNEMSLLREEMKLIRMSIYGSRENHSQEHYILQQQQQQQQEGGQPPQPVPGQLSLQQKNQDVKRRRKSGSKQG